ncbi:hypothetical protein AAIG33_00100 [Phytobacter ursingii]|uniref:hypothetical protein n=1 Tax=Phytobacter ursingii TaxID=1972431 RepID=UPI000E1E2858|nr:hypothetical protein DXF93_19025 [Escherichia coli]
MDYFFLIINSVMAGAPGYFPDAIRAMSEQSGEKLINISVIILQPIALQKLTDAHREQINNLCGNILLLSEQDDLETFKMKVKAFGEKCSSVS